MESETTERVAVGQALAEEVRAMAARQMLNQKDLAQRAGMVHSTLHRKFKGDAPWTVDDLVAVSRGLDIDPRDLLQAAITAGTPA